jgi:predicted ATP-dependent endonuclease of OLD family
MISRLIVSNYKRFTELDVSFNADLNILVGDNESGKSTILECINLALNFKINGRFPQYEITPFLFPKSVVTDYVTAVRANPSAPLPELFIELYFNDDASLAHLNGSMNSIREAHNGVKVVVRFDENYRTAYQTFATENHASISTIPIEYYQIVRYSFADENQQLDFRNKPAVSALLDATNIKLQSGTDSYVRTIINEVLDDGQKAALALAFRNLKEQFFADEAIQAINAVLDSRKGDITEKDLGVSVDSSQKSNWDAHLIPYLDQMPFHFAGMGEQSSLKLLLTLNKEAETSQIILIEELENHLSFSTMARLLSRIKAKCVGKQIFVTTHNTYVLNKLGIDNLILIGQSNQPVSLSQLSEETHEYFEKLPGYDTLRMVLAKKSILVEGPSDELIVQRAYMDAHEGRLPIEDGIDVICVRGLSFKRFLDIAKLIKSNTFVVTDNDGSYATKITAKYAPYAEDENITICASSDDTLKTLEPQIVSVNELSVLNAILGTNYVNKDDLRTYMIDSDNKTDVALKIFKSTTRIVYPPYVVSAIE